MVPNLRQSSINSLDVQHWDYSHVFIDWLKIREPNTTDMPPLNDGAIVKLDEYGEIVYLTHTTKSIEGSYSTIARIRVTESFREIDFNPSRFGRPDNLFGYRLPDAIRVVNQFLKSLNQPPLTSEYRFSRLDVTLNIATGSPGNLAAYLRDLRKRTLPRMKTRSYEGSVIYKSKSKSITVYAKHLEMRNHKSTYMDERPYREQIASDCELNGVARIELRLGRLWLNRNNLNKVELHSELVDLFKREVIKMQKEANEEATDMLTPTELGTLLMWQSGYYVKDMLAKNTYYTRRNSIRQKTGYDIGAEPPLKFVPKKNTYTTRSYVPPSWYKMPKVIEA